MFHNNFIWKKKICNNIMYALKQSYHIHYSGADRYINHKFVLKYWTKKNYITQTCLANWTAEGGEVHFPLQCRISYKQFSKIRIMACYMLKWRTFINEVINHLNTDFFLISNYPDERKKNVFYIYIYICSVMMDRVTIT